MQIFFDSPTFDNIERDKKLKTEAQVSLIGGTMGLFTGFSIISGAEVIFYLFRLLCPVENQISNNHGKKSEFMSMTTLFNSLFRLVSSLRLADTVHAVKRKFQNNIRETKTQMI